MYDKINAITNMIEAFVWPLAILVFTIIVVIGRKVFEEIWTAVWKPITNIKGGIKISLFGQLLQINTDEFGEIANMTEIDINKFFPEVSTFEAIPYIGAEIDEKVINNLKLFEEFGLKIDRINNPVILCYVGSFFYIKREYDESLRYYKMAQKITQNSERITPEVDKSTSAISCCLGWNFAADGKIESAINNFDDSIQINEKNPWAYLGKYVVYSEFQKKYGSSKGFRLEPIYKKCFESAEKYFLERIHNNVLDNMSYCGLGMLYYYEEKYEKAISQFDKAIAISRSALAYYNRAICKIKNFSDLKVVGTDRNDELNNKILDATSDLFKSIVEYPLLRDCAIGDKDFEDISNNRCYQCFVKHVELAGNLGD